MEEFINEPIEKDEIEDDIRKEFATGMTIAELKRRYLISNQEIKCIIKK